MNDGRSSGDVLPYILRKKTEASEIPLEPESSPEVLHLQDRIQRASEVMCEIQRLLHRGEESYFEDTSHGNLFRGWDAFADHKLGNVMPTANFQKRRMHSDDRWFSGSCRNPKARSSHNRAHTIVASGCGVDEESPVSGDVGKRKSDIGIGRGDEYRRKKTKKR